MTRLTRDDLSCIATLTVILRAFVVGSLLWAASDDTPVHIGPEIGGGR